LDVLIRKVNGLVWTSDRHVCDVANVPATLIQHKRELFARNCELSFWHLNTTDPTWEDDAFLALLGVADRLDTIELAAVDLSAFEAAGIEIESSTVDTRFPSLATLHRDAVKLDGKRLVAIAELLNDAILQQCTRLRTREELIETLVRGVGTRRLAKAAQLPKDMKEALAGRGIN